MLYDQAQLTVAYSQAFQVTPDPSPEQRPSLSTYAWLPLCRAFLVTCGSPLTSPLNLSHMSTTQLPSLPSWENAECPLYLALSAYSLLPSHSDLW